MEMNTFKINPVFLVTSLMMTSFVALGQQASSQGFQGQAKDAWLVGKVEMAFTLNEHLNPFHINTDVDASVVTLSGTVESDVDRDLAEEIATGVEGVAAVNNDLKVDSAGSMRKDAQGDGGRDFARVVGDATMTAVVKSKLIANQNIAALDIDVDTESTVVTLSGRVATEEQKELAGEIAMNSNNVQNVRNMLVVDSNAS
jgi:hyperosmotically inducible protein